MDSRSRDKVGALFLLALLFGGSSRATAPQPKSKKQSARQTQEEARQARVLSWLPLVQAASRLYGVPVPIILAVLDVESHGYPRALSYAGAMGLMQLMPDTAKAYIPGANPYAPEQNINGGVHLLADLWKKYGDWFAVFTAYNAGEGRLEKNPKNYRMIYVNEVMQRWPLYALVK